MKSYEALIILAGSLGEEQTGKLLEKVQAEIVKLGGSVKGSRQMGNHQFARVFSTGQSSGQYVKLTFSMDPEKVNSLTSRFKLMEDVVRVQILAERAKKKGVEVKSDGESE